MTQWHHLGCGGLVLWDMSGGFCSWCEEEGLEPNVDAEPDLTYIPAADE